MKDYILTEEEKEKLIKIIAEVEAREINQADELIKECNDRMAFAKAHSDFVKDWEKKKKEMEDDLKNRILPPNTSFQYNRALVDEIDEVIKRKLIRVQKGFFIKFNESIFKYLGKDGKARIFNTFLRKINLF